VIDRHTDKIRYATVRIAAQAGQSNTKHRQPPQASYAWTASHQSLFVHTKMVRPAL